MCWSGRSAGIENPYLVCGWNFGPFQENLYGDDCIFARVYDKNKDVEAGVRMTWLSHGFDH